MKRPELYIINPKLYLASDIDPLLDELERLKEEANPVKIEPLRSKRCVAYYSLKGNGLFAYKVEFKGKHLKWVDTREDAEYLLKLIDN
jgi:hypothetical protein